MRDLNAVSVLLSIELVGSSMTTIGGSISRARAMTIAWR